ncbi:hypothetical protein [Streptomyces fuscichromogenes]|uniref:Uncharacterized protein n=1 Tax=Streptomyces fuscichromogenes TaxID=1324013 RepID=A0A917XDJ9_9ACTN|nr:hypothetical protein [Streptomyces fuscichromogenes]GGN09525.1 hypothetical protein GCM10011578_034890 [Streptomyces fuscichromogenes]
MATHPAIGDTRLALWRRVREFAVPPAMIETATARRNSGDWAGACAAAGFDVDLDLRALARSRGRDVRDRIRADLRRLAPDLLRWHLPRIAPDGLLRPGLTMPLARYDAGDGLLCLVARTPPAWADAGQRVSLAVWDGTLSEPVARGHPHPHPSRRFRFDLHRHLWDADAADELRTRSGADRPVDGERAVGGERFVGGERPTGGDQLACGERLGCWDELACGERLGCGDELACGERSACGDRLACGERSTCGVELACGERCACGDRFACADWRLHAGRSERGDRTPGAEPLSFADRPWFGERSSCATERWADEARIVLGAEGLDSGVVVVRLDGRQRLALHLAADGAVTAGRDTAGRDTGGRAPGTGGPLVLPDAATWTLPDLALLRAGLVDAGRLHPLVAAALVPGCEAVPRSPHPDPARQGRPVDCRGARHRIGMVDGVLSPLDHSPDELRREELLVALGGPPLPCLRVIDEAHRRPDCLTGVRERLDHGDIAGALAVVEELLGPEAVLRDGPLRDELESAARRRITYGLYRAGLAGSRRGPVRTRRRRSVHDPRLGPRPADRR